MVADPQRSKKRKRSLRAWWLDFCEDTDHYLNKGKRHTTHSQGLTLLISAVFRWLRSKLGLDWIRTWWLKRASDRALRKAQKVEARGFAKFTEKLEAAATTIGYKLSAAFSWVYKLVVPERLIKSTEKKVANASTDIFKSIHEFVVAIAKRIFPKWIQQRFKFVGRAYETCYFFFTAWTKSRDLKKLAWSLPAALLAIPLLAAIALSMVYSPGDKVQHYQRSLAAAIEKRDDATEELCVDKLTQLGYDNFDRTEYYAAYMLGDEGKFEEAAERMRGIAPTDSPGYPAAHIWLAHHLMYGNIEAANRWELVETHATYAKDRARRERERINNAAERMLTECSFRKGNTVEAMERLEKLSKTNTYLYFEVFERYLIMGNREGAISYARRVDGFCKQKIREASKDKADDIKHNSTDADTEQDPPVLTAMQYGSWAKASRLLGNSPQIVIDILNDGLAANIDDEALTRQLSEVLQSQTYGQSLETPATLDYLTQLFQLNPTDPVGLNLLAQGLGKQDERLQEILVHLEENELLSFTVCMTLGDRVWQDSENPIKAASFYQWAAKLNPDHAAAWNNIAWLRGCVEETRDLEVALNAANRAIELDPLPACYETRGQIYVQMQRWEEAVHDLKIAVNGMLPDSREAHLSLATALEALGNDAPAEAHRRLANGS